SGPSDANDDPVPASERLADLAAHGRSVASQIAALQAELVSIAAEVKALEGSLVTGTAREWLALQWGLTPAESGRTMRLAQRLGELEDLPVAFAAGLLSEGTVDLLARVATPANEAELLATAEVATGGQLQTLVRDFQRVEETDETAPLPEELESLAWWVDERGMFRVRGRLAPDRGASLASAIDAARSLDLDDAGAGATPLTNAEALAQVADGYLASTANADGTVPERYTTILHVDERGAHLHDGGHVDFGVAGQLLCESWVTAVLERRGQPISISVRNRLATPAQHRALLARDRCCQYPGCGRTRHLRAHHLQHAGKGGATRLDNLVLLCPRHHRLIHRPGWRLERHGTGLHFVRPDGVVVVPNAGRRPPASHAPPDVVPRPVVPRDRLTRFARDAILHDWMTAVS
ncbi:MAG TPA: HNH endonuclease, partial [Acidimicrobiales bacterium]|nr:HNH endonuclease [Acidimicrobiales bacterium]